MNASPQLTETRYQQEVDFSLVQRARLGDKLAFAELYRLHHGRVYALCLRLAGQVPLAEEMTQDCFIRAWEKLDQFRGESKFSTWLHSLSVNQALSSLKKQRSFWARFLPVTTEADTEESTTTHTEETSVLERKILKLPERARVVFVLFAIEGYSHEEIAAMMGTSTGTSKAQYHRARNLLQEMLS
ncbi:RNA polymerase sigma factor [Shewanella algae]